MTIVGPDHYNDISHDIRKYKQRYLKREFVNIAANIGTNTTVLSVQVSNCRVL